MYEYIWFYENIIMNLIQNWTFSIIFINLSCCSNNQLAVSQ